MEPCRGYEWCPRVMEAARRIMGDDPVHGYPHVLRVLRNAEAIAGDMEVDWEILIAAVLLHDVGRPFEGEEHHAVISARMARSILASAGFPEDKIGDVEKAILAHSFSLGARAEGAEAMVLSDADKLDAIGAIGVARAFMLGGRTGRSIEDTLAHFKEKLCRLHRLLYTEEARKMAEERVRAMNDFLDALERETGFENPCRAGRGANN